MNLLEWLKGRQDSPQSRVYLADDARQLLDNKLFQAAFAQVGEYLENAALACDPDNKDKATRIVLSKQLLASVRREIERCVEDGEFAKAEIAEIDRRSRPLRFVR